MDESGPRCWWCRRPLRARIGCPPCVARRQIWFRWAAALLALVIVGCCVGRAVWDGAHRDFGACEDNIERVATGLEIYSCDHHGRYPDSLSALTAYFPQVPTCPSASSQAFGYTANYDYHVSHEPVEQYTLSCVSHYHSLAGFALGYPQYTSVRGLLTQPDTVR